MFIKLIKSAIVGAAVIGITTTTVFADSSSIIDKLYEKGVLNDEDYAELNKEAKEERREAAEKAAEDSDPNKISCNYKDGYKCASKDGQFKFQIAGRIQQDYRQFDTSQVDEFDIRRLYFGIKGTVYGDWNYELTSNLNESNSKSGVTTTADDNGALEYAFIEYAGNPNAKIRIGSQKFFYSFEEMTSSRFTDFAERSVVNSFVIAKDRGIQIHGDPIKNQFGYSVGYYQGEGKADEGNNGKGVVGRLAYNFTGDAGKKKGTIAHVDLAVAQAHADAGDNKDSSGEAKSDTKIFSTTDTTTDHDEQFVNFGTMVAKGPFKFQAENNRYTVSPDGAGSWGVTTRYIAVNWLLTGENYADNYSLGGMKAITPNQTFNSAGGMGAWELGVRKSNSNVDAAGTSASNTTNESLTVGLKWIPNHKTRFILNNVRTKYGAAVSSRTSESAWILRAQLDF
jgi:phosphate-selective porin OprO/OprP